MEKEDKSEANPYSDNHFSLEALERSPSSYDSQFYNDIYSTTNNELNIDQENCNKKPKKFKYNQFVPKELFQQPVILSDTDVTEENSEYHHITELIEEEQRLQVIQEQYEQQQEHQIQSFPENDADSDPIQPQRYFEPTNEELEGCSCTIVILMLISAIIPLSGFLIAYFICGSRRETARRCMIITCLSIVVYLLLIVAFA